MIGRKNEIDILTSECEKTTSRLIVIHGRRRIGKTYLVDHMFLTKKNDCIFFKFTGSADQDSNVQIDYFIEAIYEWFKIEPKKKDSKMASCIYVPKKNY